MKVAILAAGIGYRLRPETADKPKAMIEIAGKPLVQHQIDSVRKAGFAHEDIVILSGYKSERMKAYWAKRRGAPGKNKKVTKKDGATKT